MLPRIESIKQIRQKIGITQKKLAAEGESSSHTAGDFCSKEIIKLKPSNTLHDAIKKMHELSISQIPIFNNAEVVGVISEDGIVKHLSELGEAELKKAKLQNTMEPVPPIVDWNTPANVLVPLIRYSKCILVTKKLKFVGIITASDTLKMME